MFIESLIRDVRFAFRGFSRRTGFTAIVVVTLAIGIGSNVAIFSVANAVLFRALPYQDPERLVLVWNRSSTADAGRSLVSGPDFLDYKTSTTMFKDFAGAFAINGTITGEGRAEQLMMGWTTQNLFKVLGVRPIVGRDFNEDDVTFVDPATFTDPNAVIPPGFVILSHGLWTRRFGGDPAVLGRTLELDGQPNIVAGVLPSGFRIYLPADAGMPTNIDVWRVLPLDMETSPRDAPWVTVVGRLKPGYSLEQAQDEMTALAARLREQYAFHANSGMQIELNSMQRDVVQHVRPILLAMVGAGGFVLLIACANVANLLLARATAREGEIALRSALGGGQSQIIRQMLVESVVLSGAGALVGLALAWAGIRFLRTLRPDNLPRLEQVSFDGTVLLFALSIALFSAVIFGLTPALKSSTPNLVNALKDRGSDVGRIRGNKLRTALVVLEVALSLVLLVGAGLLLRSFSSLQSVEPGFQSKEVLTFSMPLPFYQYRAMQPRTDFYLRLNERLEALPGVIAAGSTTPLPLAGGDQYYVFSYGRLDVTEEEWNANKADYRWTTPGYFKALGIPLLAGRLMSPSDNQGDGLEVVVVDDKLANRAWPNEDPVDKLLRIQRFNPDFTMERATVRVVGVVGHVRSESLGAEGREAVYFPHRQFAYAPQSVAVKASTNALGLVKAIEAEVRSLDPNVPIADVLLMEEYVSRAVAQTRFTLTLLSVFSMLALILASIGLYGVMSYSVNQRTTEIGVRMAFGAQKGSILRLVVGQGMVVAISGVVVGLLVAFAFTRVVSSLLFGVTATDPVTFAGISLLLIGVGALASYFPARRAMRVDPLDALSGRV